MRNFLAILFLLLILISTIIGGIYFFDWIGAFSKEETLYPYLAKLPGIGGIFAEVKAPWEDVHTEELRRLKEGIEAKLEEIKRKEAELAQKEMLIAKKEKELEAWEEDFLQRKNAFEAKVAEYENKEKRLQKLATYYGKMKPEDAAKILQQMDDLMVIDILRRMDDATVAMTLMKMDPKKASDLSRKMHKF